MDIDLSLLHSNTVDNIDISGVYTIPKEYYQTTDIIKLENINVEGIIDRRPDEEGELQDYINIKISGIMTLPDSISLKEVDYNFSVEYNDIIEENCKKNQNTLDIFSVLWENIVLEVPLRFTKERDLSKFHGDGWKLVDEDELKNSNNPFSDLLKDFEEE